MKQRICIGIPCYSTVPAETLEDYMRFAFHLGRRYQDYDFFLRIKSKSEQFRARNAIVESAISIGCDWLLMMDDDHIIDTNDDMGNPDTGAEAYNFLQKLLDHNVDIVGPLYYQRGGGALPVVMDENEMGDPYFISDLDLGMGLEERAVQGGGCMLINMKVFDKIPSPWFAPEYQWGTDVQICKNARNAGFHVYNDPSIVIGHVMSDRIVVTEKNKDQFKNRDSAGVQATESEVGWRTDSLLHKFKYDAGEFLGIKENDLDSELRSLWGAYPFVALALKEKYGEGSPEYYSHMGPEQLARQVMFHFGDACKITMASLLQEIKPQRMVGMDFGCGSAPIGFELAKRGGKVHFVDIDGACAYEFTKWRCKKYGLDNASFEWPEPGTVNYCLAMDSVEHLTEWKSTMLKIIECLRPGGNILTNFMRLKDDKNPEHVFMDKGAFASFMIENGMVISTDCVFVKTFS